MAILTGTKRFRNLHNIMHTCTTTEHPPEASGQQVEMSRPDVEIPEPTYTFEHIQHELQSMHAEIPQLHIKVDTLKNNNRDLHTQLQTLQRQNNLQNQLNHFMQSCCTRCS